MSDYERYGDYNDIEDDAPKSKNPIVIIIKILIGLVCVGVVGFLAFRLFLFNSYPDKVSELYFNEELYDFYVESDSDIKVLTQKLRYPYDDEKEGNFFCDNLYVIEEAGQLQITVRYNASTVRKINEKYGLTLDDGNPDIFEYKLTASFGEGDLRSYGKLSDKINASQVMYRYSKLVFDGVELCSEDGVRPYWIRLEITVPGASLDEPFMIPIYENNEDNSTFSEYEVKENMLPNE